MIVLLATLATAGELTHAVEVANAFVLDTPATYRMRGDHPTFSEGWLLKLTVPAGSIRARQAALPILYIGEWPVRVVNPSETGTCAVVWLPGPVDLAADPVFMGPAVLPERVNQETARAARAEALKRGETPLASEQVQQALKAGELLTGVGLDGVWAAATTLAATCVSPAD
jgi:hypothetical protein